MRMVDPLMSNWTHKTKNSRIKLHHHDFFNGGDLSPEGGELAITSTFPSSILFSSPNKSCSGTHLGRERNISIRLHHRLCRVPRLCRQTQNSARLLAMAMPQAPSIQYWGHGGWTARQVGHPMQKLGFETSLSGIDCWPYRSLRAWSKSCPNSRGSPKERTAPVILVFITFSSLSVRSSHGVSYLKRRKMV